MQSHTPFPNYVDSSEKKMETFTYPPRYRHDVEVDLSQVRDLLERGEIVLRSKGERIRFRLRKDSGADA